MLFPKTVKNIKFVFLIKRFLPFFAIFTAGSMILHDLQEFMEMLHDDVNGRLQR